MRRRTQRIFVSVLHCSPRCSRSPLLRTSLARPSSPHCVGSPLLRTHSREHGHPGVLALELSDLPLARDQPQRIEQARAQARPSVTLTNDVSSPLATASDLVIDLAAGPERAIASSKTFSATWQALAQLVAGPG